ncbi:unnamed protein product [Sphagnum balticum]
MRSFRGPDWQSSNGVSQASVSQTIFQFAGVGAYLRFHRLEAALTTLMKREGLISEFPVEDVTVMEVAELLPYLVRILVHLRHTVTAVMEFKPHVAVIMDAKGFSFRALCSISGGENNLKNLADTLDHLLCILPFEAALFEAHGIGTTSFRHPVLEDAFISVAVFTSSYLNPLSFVGNT